MALNLNPKACMDARNLKRIGLVLVWHKGLLDWLESLDVLNAVHQLVVIHNKPLSKQESSALCDIGADLLFERRKALSENALLSLGISQLSCRWVLHLKQGETPLFDSVALRQAVQELNAIEATSGVCQVKQGVSSKPELRLYQARCHHWGEHGLIQNNWGKRLLKPPNPRPCSLAIQSLEPPKRSPLMHLAKAQFHESKTHVAYAQYLHACLAFLSENTIEATYCAKYWALKACKLNPERPEAYTILKLVSNLTGDYKKAQVFYLKALELNPQKWVGEWMPAYCLNAD